MFPAIKNWIWPKKQTPEEYLRECVKKIAKGKREIQKAMNELDEENAELLQSAKDAVKMGMDQSHILQMAQQIVMKRNIGKKLQMVVWKLDQAKTNIVLLKATALMQKTMVDLTIVMRSMTRGLDARGMDKILNEFEKQTNIMEAKQESIDSTLDQTMSPYDDETASKELMAQICHEIGLKIDLPENKPPHSSNSLDPDIVERIRKLNEP